MSLRLLPNALTLFRMIAVGPIVYMLLSGRHLLAFALAVFAGISDLLDGYLARRYGWKTHFGGVLDPLADKLLLVSTTLALAWLGHLPWWLVFLVVLRDAVIVGGGLFYHHFIARITPSAPTTVSKWNTLFQILLVVSVMFSLAFPRFSGAWIMALVYIVAVTTVVSGVQYVVIWSLRANRQRGRD
ncbi:MAG TPA: CDP-alcohol phosphatidyltransferase family protein [Xanthomonadales bacterium]|nr:CDP-alcohol phosphatidyltransferase family protein [Xanthomonadales bacterium]